MNLQPWFCRIPAALPGSDDDLPPASFRSNGSAGQAPRRCFGMWIGLWCEVDTWPQRWTSGLAFFGPIVSFRLVGRKVSHVVTKQREFRGWLAACVFWNMLWFPHFYFNAGIFLGGTGRLSSGFNDGLKEDKKLPETFANGKRHVIRTADISEFICVLTYT